MRVLMPAQRPARPAGARLWATPAIVGGAILVGSVIGGASPSAGDAMGSVVDALVITLVVALFVDVPLHRLPRTPGAWKVIGIAWSMNFLLAPLVAFLLTRVALPGHPAVQLGVMLYFLAPCTDWFLAFTRLSDGDTAVGATLLPINMVTQLLLFPVWITVLGGNVGIDAVGTIGTLLQWFVLPAAIAVVIRLGISLLPDGARARAAALPGRAVPWIVGAMVDGLFASHIGLLLANLPVFVAVLGCAVVFFAVTFIAAEWASRLAALSYPRSALLAMTTAARNAPLMIGLTSAALPHQPLVTTAIVVGMLVEFPHLLAVRHLLLRRRRGQHAGRRLRGTAAWGHP
ncbi:hypothetical protein DEJ01_17030 [Curtobacterium sp. MCLR17_040]|nr:hypothetical protein DEJ01_17030 [Curtobacterium sp. MCLR17_040]